MKFPIFLDNHSTTPMDPRVLEAMLPYFVEKFGNAASRNHAFGWEAEEAVDTARQQLARLIKADPQEIAFTRGSAVMMRSAATTLSGFELPPMSREFAGSPP